MFRVVILGSGASLPTLQRNSAAAAVQYEGDLHLFDCGEGTQLQWRRAGLRFGRLRAIHVSHLHGDHVNGLVGLLQTLSLAGRDAEVLVSGPPGIDAYLGAIRRHQGVRFGYPVRVLETSTGEVFAGDGYQIRAASLDHGPPTIGFTLVEDERPGRFDLEAARRRGLEPGPDFGRLQAGQPVAAPDGTMVQPDEVLGAPRRGRALTYCVDTRPCEAAVELATGSTLFVCEATFGSELAEEARARGHSTAAQAAEMARDAAAERLLLTHVSARYHDPRPLLKEARAIFPATDVAADLMEVSL